MTRTEATQTSQATIAIHATCPHCGFNLNILTVETIRENNDQYLNSHGQGRGGFRTVCESCGEAFVIEASTVHEVQHVALVLLGEA